MNKGINKLVWMLVISFIQSFASAQVKIASNRSDVCLKRLISGGYKSEIVEYTLVGCVGCTNIEWDIGNGFQTTGMPTFSTSYSTAGFKTVKCRYKTASGGTVELALNNAVRVRESPSINIGYSNTLLCYSSDSVTITDLSDSTVTRQWLIDGVNFNPGPKSLKLAFTPNKAITVFMRGEDKHGCGDNYLKDSAIVVLNTVKTTITPSQMSGCAPQLIDFISTIDSGLQTIKSVLWTFENSSPTTSNLRNPKGINFTSTDSSDVQLEITSTQGCTYTYKRDKLIALGQSTALDISISDTTICANSQVVLTNTNSKIPVPQWKITGPGYSIDSSRGRKLYLRFLDTGLATITVFEDFNGCYSSTTAKSNVLVTGPLSLFTSVLTNYCSTPDTLRFENISTTEPGKNTTWKWTIYEKDSGRVGGGDSANFSYITNKLSTYNVELIADGNNGCKDTFLMENASVGDTLIALFDAVPSPACINQKVALIDKTANEHSLYRNNLRWTFYDASGSIIKTSTLLRPTHSYTTEGSYDAKLVVENAKGCKDSITLKDSIIISSPEVSLSVEDTSICTYESVQFFAQRISGNPNSTGRWTFENIDSIGNIVSRSGDTVTFLTARPGRWIVKFRLTDTSGGGCLTVFTMKEKLNVSGAYAIPIASPDFGCPPLNTTLDAKIIHNWDFDNPTNKPITWEWRQLNYSRGFVFTDSTKQSTTGLAPKGVHVLQIRWTNGSGCSFASNFTQVNSGVKAAFRMKTGLRCVNTVLETVNQSSAQATSFEYICDSSSVQFLPNKFAKEPDIIFTKTGVFSIKLIAKYGTCPDTFTTYIRAEDIIADFYSPDTVAFCAPKIVLFKNLTKGSPATSSWTFGDEASAVSFGMADYSKLYEKNNPDGFDISLIVENGRGCRDTITKKQYIRLIGPVPDFTLKNNKGCEPLNVALINNSKSFSSYFVDFGDGGSLDSSNPSNHEYVVTIKSRISQIYKPSILMFDDNGCAAFAEAKDAVEVLKRPEGNFTFSSSQLLTTKAFKGCANTLLVQFSNQSQFYSSISWDFNGDGNIDAGNVNDPSYFYKNPGVFVPTLYSEYLNGCKDTFSKDTIISLDFPKADFRIVQDSICLKDSSKFQDLSISLNPIVKYTWDFGQSQHFDDTSSLKNPSYWYKTPLEHNVELLVRDSQGCTSQISKTIFVADTVGPSPNLITYATVNPDNSITFSWRPFQAKNFYNYSIFEETPSKVYKGQSFDIKDTSFTISKGLSVNTNRFCYSIQIEDTCGYKGKFAEAHCTILLTAKSTQNYHNELTWLAYDYWNADLSYYEVWRKAIDESTFTKIADVNAVRQSYIDSFLCKKEYCYFVKAINKNRIYTSTSNRACSTPIYTIPTESVAIELVTVENNSYIKAQWKKYPLYIRGGKYQLERSTNGSGTFYPILTTDELSVKDIAADFNSSSFEYRIKYIDHCGSIGPAGTPSNSIYVSSPDISGTININWNPYEYWASGVKEYKVQYSNALGIYEEFASVDGKTTLLKNIEVSSFETDSLCLRIVAVKDTSILIQSISNRRCFVDKSVIWVPTAFSPNKDGKNDVFKVFARNIRRDVLNPDFRYNCQVFNRWGQKVFETFDFNESWDGTFNKKNAPNGLYIVRVYAVGYDGEAFKYKGTLSIER